MNDDETAESPTEEVPPDPPPARPSRPRRLLRSSDDRMIAGVAGGLGSYFGIDPVIFRIGFGVSVFFGGLGLIAYLALAVLVPSGDGEGVHPAPVQRSRWIAAAAIAVGLVLVLSAGSGFLFGGPDWGLVWLAIVGGIGVAIYFAVKNTDGPIGIGRILLIAALTLAAIVGLALLAVASAWATAEGGGAVMAGLVIAAAVGLVIAAFVGGARWLIVPALAIAIPVGSVSAAGIELEGGYGQRHYSPVTAEALPSEGYELAAGQLLVDLREIDWEREEVVSLDVDMGFGEAVIAIPEEVCLEAAVHADAGEIDIDGSITDGLDVDDQVGIGSTETPRLSLDGQIVAGLIRVVGDDDVEIEFDDHDRGPFVKGDDVVGTAPRECAA